VPTSGFYEDLLPSDIFLLFCTKVGMRNPYAIFSHTQVGVGASVPALKRLEMKGLLSSTTDDRKRVTYSLTEKGDERLKSSLDAGLTAYGRPTNRGIFESLRRVIFFSWVKGKPEEAIQALDRARRGLTSKYLKANFEVQVYQDELEHSEGESLATGEYDSPEYISLVFKLIKATADSAEARLQAEALDTLWQLIQKLPPTPRTFLKDTSGRTHLTSKSRKRAKTARSN
jgi:DNA-binding PadR family transcriptional regulator